MGPWTTAQEPDPTRRSVLSSHVVGRDGELAALDEALATAANGRGGVVFFWVRPGSASRASLRSWHRMPSAVGWRSCGGGR